jgi:hypothetical protein
MDDRAKSGLPLQTRETMAIADLRHHASSATSMDAKVLA